MHLQTDVRRNGCFVQLLRGMGYLLQNDCPGPILTKVEYNKPGLTFVAYYACPIVSPIGQQTIFDIAYW